MRFILLLFCLFESESWHKLLKCISLVNLHLTLFSRWWILTQLFWKRGELMVNLDLMILLKRWTEVKTWGGWVQDALWRMHKRGTTISLIDNIFTNDTDHKIRSPNLVTDISDHFPNFVSVKGHRYQNAPKFINKNTRQFKPDNIKGFKTTLLMLIGILWILMITQKLRILNSLTK